MIAQGKTNKEIALATGRTVKTIKSHCTVLFRDYKVKNRTQFAVKFNEIQQEIISRLDK